MRTFTRISVALMTMAVVASARPARADVTVVYHYTLVDGDTLTRANYYSNRRVRVTAPDGKEYLFDSRTDTITVIDHETKRYWTGPRSLADSVASKIMASHREGVPEIATTDPVAWGERLAEFNKSIRVEATGKQLDIANYQVDQWILTAGTALRSEQWIARQLAVRNYGPELQRVVLASIADPMGRALTRLMIGMRTKDGLVLSNRTTFETYKGTGSFRFDATKVIAKSIPASAWALPVGYTQVRL